MRLRSSLSSSAFMLDEWLHVWCSSPGRGGRGERKGEPTVGQTPRWHLRSEALTWQRRAAGARVAAPDQSEICGQSHRWRREPLALHSRGGSGGSRLSTSYDFRAPFKRLSPVRHVSHDNEGNQDIKLSRTGVEKTKNGSCFSCPALFRC